MTELAFEFIAGELVPTLAALFIAAACEPLTWSVAGAVVLVRAFSRRLSQP
jgi:hypothetical protein